MFSCPELRRPTLVSLQHDNQTHCTETVQIMFDYIVFNQSVDVNGVYHLLLLDISTHANCTVIVTLGLGSRQGSVLPGMM